MQAFLQIVRDAFPINLYTFNRGVLGASGSSTGVDRDGTRMYMCTTIPEYIHEAISGRLYRGEYSAEFVYAKTYGSGPRLVEFTHQITFAGQNMSGRKRPEKR